MVVVVVVVLIVVVVVVVSVVVVVVVVVVVIPETDLKWLPKTCFLGERWLDGKCGQSMS